MFCVTEAEAEAIRTVFLEDGELSAAITLRRMFSGIADNAKARLLARQIAGWKPPTPQSATDCRRAAATVAERYVPVRSLPAAR